MNPPATDIGDDEGGSPLARVLGVIKAWLEFAVAAAVALARVVSGKDQCAELISTPPELTQPVTEEDDATEEVDGAP